MSERLLNTVVALGQLVERTGLQEAAILAQGAAADRRPGGP